MYFTEIRYREKRPSSYVVFSPKVSRRSNVYTPVQHMRLLYDGWFHWGRPQLDNRRAKFHFQSLTTHSGLLSKQTPNVSFNNFAPFFI